MDDDYQSSSLSICHIALMVELVDAADSKSVTERCEGSSPSWSTKLNGK